eukprot:XP_017952015.1 PREDICTED: uncharacterized protein LOC108648298 [Xenopus tropicalis]
MSGASPGPARAGRAARKTEAQALGPSHVAVSARPRLRSSSVGTPRTPRGKTSSESEMEVEKSVEETRRQRQRNAAAARAQEVEARRGAPQGKITPPRAANADPLVKGKVDGKQVKQQLASEEEIKQHKHKGMEIQTVPLIHSEFVTELPAVSETEPVNKPVSVTQTDNNETAQSDSNLCQNPPQQRVSESCEQQGPPACNPAASPAAQLESVGHVGAGEESAIHSSVCVSQPACQESGAPGAAASPGTGTPTSPAHGAASACSSGEERGEEVPTIAPVPLSSEGSSPGASPGTSIVHKPIKGAACKGAVQKQGRFKGEVKETITAERVADALKELATLQNRKKSVQLSLKYFTNRMAVSEGKVNATNKNKWDELGKELAGIEQQIAELYKEVGPWKEVYQNRQRFADMAANVRSPAAKSAAKPAAKPALRKPYQASTSNSPASSESEADFVKPLPPRVQKRQGRVNWQNMAFNQQDVDDQEKKRSEEKTFKVNVGKQDQTFELLSDQDFPELPKAQGKVMANPIHQSGSGKAQRGGTCDPVGTVSEAREEDLQTEKMDIAPTNTSSCVKASERVESGVNEVNEVQASVSGGHERVNEVQAPVSVGHVRVSEAVPGAGGTERECGGVQGGEVGGAMGVGAAHVLAEVRQGQVDQGPSEAVEVESVQVGGQANPTNFWEKRRLFPVPDFSDNDPFKRKNWVKVKWEGNKEGAPPRRFFVRKVLLDGMGFSSDDLSAVIGQTESEYDITFKLPEVLDHFWRIYNLQKRAGHPDWENLIVIPMTKPETKNITIMMKNDAIPQEDILVWLQRQCTVVSPLVKIFDEDNVWGGGWRTQVKLNVTGNVPTHLPNSFFIGKEKGTCFYVGQPRRCFKCGARDHLAKACTVLRCALCNAVGHEANSCNRVRCNLCNRMGHSHRRCPEAYHNIVNSS